MPHVDAFTLMLVDRGLRGVGVVLFAIVLIRLVRSDQWRNPLIEHDLAHRGPRLVHLIGVLVAFYAVLLVLAQVVEIDPENVRASGSHDWHLARCVEDGAKLLACVLIVVLLRQYRPFPDRPGPRSGLVNMLGVTGAAVPIILAITSLQLQTGQTIWHWLEPDARQPIHTVLEALENSVWGPWGTVHLSVAAIIVAPLAEELFFRGLLLQTIWGYFGHAWLAIALSGVAFGLIHNQQPQDVLPLATMGFVLGYVRVRYRSLTACILIHMLFNARTMLFVLLNPETARGGF